MRGAAANGGAAPKTHLSRRNPCFRAPLCRVFVRSKERKAHNWNAGSKKSSDTESCLLRLPLFRLHTHTGLGMGVQLLLATFLQQFRIVERFRLYFTKTWEAKDASPWRIPNNFLQLTEKTLASSSSDKEDSSSSSSKDSFLFQSTHGSVRVLVSSAQAATSSMQMAIITLRPSGEMPTARAASLEVYQVLSGTGHVSQQGVTTTHQVTAGQLWVVDPGSLRWMNNPSTTTDLVVLRTVDAKAAVYNASGSALNRITQDSARRTLSVVEQVSVSMQRYGKMACEYYYRKQPTSSASSSTAQK